MQVGLRGVRGPRLRQLHLEGRRAEEGGEEGQVGRLDPGHPCLCLWEEAEVGHIIWLAKNPIAQGCSQRQEEFLKYLAQKFPIHTAVNRIHFSQKCQSK